MPTLLIAGAALHLLKNEQERIALAAVHGLSLQAAAVGESIHLTIETVQENLDQALLEIPRDAVQKELVRWEDTNPLVRNVFVWQPGKGLLYPPGGMASTSEERQFIDRYGELFQGQGRFDAYSGRTAREGRIESSASAFINSYESRAAPSPRKKLLALSRQAVQENRQVYQEAERLSDVWKPAFQGKKG